MRGSRGNGFLVFSNRIEKSVVEIEERKEVTRHLPFLASPWEKQRYVRFFHHVFLSVVQPLNQSHFVWNESRGENNYLFWRRNWGFCCFLALWKSKCWSILEGFQPGSSSKEGKRFFFFHKCFFFFLPLECIADVIQTLHVLSVVVHPVLILLQDSFSRIAQDSHFCRWGLCCWMPCQTSLTLFSDCCSAKVV